ncbi:MAG: YcxB family protein [Desulfobacteraceae bacterium]
MQIRYRNTLEHLVALQKYVLRKTDFGKKMMLHRFIAVEVIVLFITIIFAINHNRFKVFLGFVIITGLAWLFRERSVLLQFKRDFKRERRKDDKGLFDKDRILTIAPDGLKISIGDTLNQYAWDQVVMVGHDRKLLYIILKGVLHYVIPLSAFADENEALLFLDRIESYCNRF